MANDHFYDEQQHGMLDQAMKGAWTGKAELVQAATLKEFTLNGLTEQAIQQTHFVGGDRLAFPTFEPGNLTFEPLKLLTGVLAGDFEDEERSRVATYYPHVREGRLAGKTVFHLTLPEAGVLAKKAASVLDIEPDKLRDAVQRMDTKFSMFQPEQFKLHKKDIIPALADHI